MRAIASTFFTLILAGSLQLATAQPAQVSDSYIFSGDTQLFIDGTSSLHDWTCDVERTEGRFATSSTDDGSSFSVDSGSLSVSVDDIECGKGTMNKKLRKALTINDAESIDFVLTAARVASTDDGDLSFDFSGDLSIAGTTRPVSLTAIGSSESDTIRLEGSYSLLQTDFGVDPPSALLGRLKTGDEVTIRFVVTAARDQASL